MSENDTAQKLAFLYKIIDDNQATIRFLDTKAAFGIAVLGAMVGKALDPDQLAGFATHGIWNLLAAIVFALLTAIAAALGFRTVFPTVNPAQNVSFPDDLEPKFFIAKLNPRSFWRYLSSNKKFAMLETKHSAYLGAVNQSTPEKLLSVAAAEVLKLSFIRQLKTDRLTAFSRALICAVIMFIILTFSAQKSTPDAAIRESSTSGVQSINYTLTCPENGGNGATKPAIPKKPAQLRGSPKKSPTSANCMMGWSTNRLRRMPLQVVLSRVPFVQLNHSA
jgi:hypothetical protein